MKQVVQNYKTGKIKLEEVSVPFCKSGGVVVRNICSAVSVGTERLMIDMAKKSLLGKAIARPDLVRLAYQKALKEGFISVFKEAMNRLDESIPMGYSSGGEVVEIGKGVSRFKVGDRVVCAGAGFAVHAQYIWIPENLCIKFPDILDFESASFGMIGAIAVNGIRKANLTFGENVAVIGLGLIGLITVQVLKSYGCRVVGIDLDKNKVNLAEELGVDLGLKVDKDNILSEVENFTRKNGFDAVIITAASGDTKPVRLAEDIVRRKGRIVLVGVADLKLTRKIFWEKELSFIVARAAGEENDYHPEINRWTQGRNIEHFIDLLIKNKVKMDKLITHYFKIEEALKCYDMILKKKEPHIGVVFRYSDNLEINDSAKKTRLVFKQDSLKKQFSRLNVGVIGGGNFTKNILLPALKKVNGINLVGIATTKGISSQQVGKKFGFNYCSSDYKEILTDKSIGSIIVSTQHNLHSIMIIDGLKAEKNVFVEKPLCLNIAELKEIVKIFSGSGQRLMVGFNRRFSSLTMQAKSCLEKRSTALMLNYRVNAGNVADGHWVNDIEVSGGRIIGEICHFIDFFQFITNAHPQKIYVESIGGNQGKYSHGDNVCLTVCLSDGSVGTIIYNTKGSKAFSRERIEIFSEDSVVMIEDFKKLIMVKGNKKRRIVKMSQDLGYVNELNCFFDADRFNHEDFFKQYLYTSLATFKALDSLKTGKCVKIELEEVL